VFLLYAVIGILQCSCSVYGEHAVGPGRHADGDRTQSLPGSSSHPRAPPTNYVIGPCFIVLRGTACRHVTCSGNAAHVIRATRKTWDNWAGLVRVSTPEVKELQIDFRSLPWLSCTCVGHVDAIRKSRECSSRVFLALCNARSTEYYQVLSRPAGCSSRLTFSPRFRASSACCLDTPTLCVTEPIVMQFCLGEICMLIPASRFGHTVCDLD
jgi:hypothetical protein